MEGAGFDATAWLRPSDAARALGVSIATLMYHVRRGRLGVLVTPLGRLIARADVESFQQARAARADDAAGE
jgi:predicted site-specific integrase-resolvase